MKNKERGYTIPSRENIKVGDTFYLLMFDNYLHGFPITHITKDYVSHREEGFSAKTFYDEAIIKSNGKDGTDGNLLVGKKADPRLLEEVLKKLNIQ
jgi:hypothetical protein